VYRSFGCQKGTRLGGWITGRDLLRTTHTVKTQHVTKCRGRHCGDIELAAYLANAAGPVHLVLDLRIAHDRFGSSSDLNLTGHLHYPNDIDISLNEAATDKTRKYRADYNNLRLSHVCLLLQAHLGGYIVNLLFVRLLFLRAHRGTYRFFAALGVQLARTNRGQFHFRRVVFSSQLKARVALASLRLQLYVLRLIWMGHPSRLYHTLTHHTRKLLVC
jgi:hypothetical protein